MKKSRKKILLSSIAMLLVALVALGSATFAWFTMNKSVTADTMVVKAIAPAGIEISNKNDGTKWTDYSDTGVSFDSGKTLSLNPVSWNVAGTGGGLTATPYAPDQTVSAQGKGYTGTYAAATTYSAIEKVDSTATEMYKNGFFAVYKMHLRAKADADGNVITRTGAKVKVTYSDNDSEKKAAGYIRTAVIEAGTLKAKYGAAATTDDVKNEAINSTAGGKVEQSLTAYNNNVDISNIDGTGKEYWVVVWFEGFDAECKDANASANGTLTVEYSFT